MNIFAKQVFCFILILSFFGCKLDDNRLRGSIGGLPSQPGSGNPPPSLAGIGYTVSASYEVGSPLVITPTGSNSGISYSISPTLPAGIELDNNTGEITGTPQSSQEETEYTITISNGTDSADIILKLTFHITFNVTNSANTNDDNPGDNICADSLSNCTLRSAIEEANAQNGPTVVNVAPATYNVNGTSLSISKNVTLKGSGIGTTIIDGNSTTERVLNIAGSSIFSLEDISIENGKCTSGFSSGCGIYSESPNVTLKNCQIKNNSADEHASGIGVCIFNGSTAIGTLTIDNCVFDNNDYTALKLADGGGLFFLGKDILITDSVFKNNSADNGGALYVSSSEISIANSTFDSNIAEGNGGGIILSATNSFELLNSNIKNNQAQNGNGGGLEATSSLQSLIDNTDFTNNSSALRGGAIYDRSTQSVIKFSDFTGNTSNSIGGGAIYTHNNTSFQVEDSSFEGNLQTSGGDGVDIFHYNTDNVIINRSYFGSPAAGSRSITNKTPGDSFEVTNSTFYNHNTAIYLEFALSTKSSINNCSFLSNGRALSLTGSASLTIANSLVANSGTSACFDGSSGGFISGGYNVIDDNSCSLGDTGDLENTDPLFVIAGPQDNGGETKSILLQAGSPAIDSGDNATCTPEDQRNTPRPVNYSSSLTCDRGAIEMTP